MKTTDKLKANIDNPRYKIFYSIFCLTIHMWYMHEIYLRKRGNNWGERRFFAFPSVPALILPLHTIYFLLTTIHNILNPTKNRGKSIYIKSISNTRDILYQFIMVFNCQIIATFWVNYYIFGRWEKYPYNQISYFVILFVYGGSFLLCLLELLISEHQIRFPMRRDLCLFVFIWVFIALSQVVKVGGERAGKLAVNFVASLVGFLWTDAKYRQLIHFLDTEHYLISNN